jgi:heat shock protein 1/8
LIGNPAKNQATTNPTNTVFDAKRLIGRRFNDPTVQSDIKLWPFKVINAIGIPKIQVEFKNELKTFTPEEISSMVLIKIKKTAEAFLECRVKDAVITVPAYFNDEKVYLIFINYLFELKGIIPRIINKNISRKK